MIRRPSIKRMFKNPAFMEAFNAAEKAARPKDATPPLDFKWEFDFDGAHYAFSTSEALLPPPRQGTSRA